VVSTTAKMFLHKEWLALFGDGIHLCSMEYALKDDITNLKKIL
jgi:hypothetical protein